MFSFHFTPGLCRHFTIAAAARPYLRRRHCRFSRTVFPFVAPQPACAASRRRLFTTRKYAYSLLPYAAAAAFVLLLLHHDDTPRFITPCRRDHAIIRTRLPRP